MERGVLACAAAARREGYDARLLLFDAPCRGSTSEYDPGTVPWSFVERRPGIDLQFPFRLAREFARIGVDIVHARNHTSLLYCGAALRLMGSRQPRLVATFHTSPAGESKRARAATFYAGRAADAITSVSADLSRLIVAERWAKRCETIRNGVDVDRFAPTGERGAYRQRLGLSEDTLLIAQVARFDANKRQADLLDAFRHLRQRISNIALVFVGDGPTRNAVATNGDEAVHFLPSITDVESLLRDADIFVLCSDHEGAPRALLEAMATGCAVVATHVGGVPEIVGQGASAGLMVPSRSPEALADALYKLSCSPETRQNMGTAARSRVVEMFTAEREWADYYALYERVLKSKKPTG